MRKKIINIALSIILQLFSLILYSQQAENNNLTVFFIKEQVEVTGYKSAFNVLKIINKGISQKKLSISFGIPNNWTLLGEKIITVNVQPNSFVTIPVRVSPSPDAKGGIGYSAIASLTDENGESIAIRYFFLTIPIKTNILLQPQKRYYYFNDLSNSIDIKTKILNKGNSDQIYTFSLSAEDNVVFNRTDNNLFTREIFVPAGSDTIVTNKVSLVENKVEKRYVNKRLNIELTNKDTTLKKNIWLRYLDYIYSNQIPEAEWPLIVEVSALNLFSNYLRFRYLVYGNIIFQKQRSLSYYMQSQNINNSNYIYNQDNEIHIVYKTPTTRLKVGDIRDFSELGAFGKGVSLEQKIGSVKLNAIASKNFYTNHINGELLSTLNLGNKNSQIGFGVGTSINERTEENSKLAYFVSRINAVKNHIFSFKIGYSQADYFNLPEYKRTGNAYDVSYGFRYAKFRFRIRAFYGTPYYAGYQKGRAEIRSENYYYLNEKNYFLSYYNYYRYIPAKINNDLPTNYYLENQTARIIYNRVINNSVTFYLGPNIEIGRYNYLFNQQLDNTILTSNQGEIGVRYTPRYGIKSLNLSVRTGATYISKYDKELNISSSYLPELFLTTNVNMNITGENWGLYNTFYNGPVSISQSVLSFYSGTFNRVLFIMPYYSNQFFENRFSYSARATYITNFDANITRMNISNRFGWNLNKGWSFKFTANMNYQSIEDPSSGLTYRYIGSYFEFSLKKIFQWKQPGKKYHHINTIFYRDLNGNKIKEGNEPGVEKVLVNIIAPTDLDSNELNRKGTFSNVELASNQFGKTIYENIPGGVYELSFDQSQTYTGEYTILENKARFDLNKDTTLYVPFSEKNKVYGNVILNRAPRSALGDLSPANIRISITDSQGEVHTGLTDENGYYEIYAPVTDFYTVKVNNIFSEYFDIENDRYVVKFNGYKLFEVNFVFNERKREIIIADVDIDEPDNKLEDEEGDFIFEYEDVKQIKQVILRGQVRDENSMLPLKAKIRVIEHPTQNLISKIASSSTNGKFYTSFIAGENYMLLVEATGYWTIKEQLNIKQITTFETISKDLLMSRIIVNEKLDFQNLVFKESKVELSPEAKAELENLVILLHNNEGVNISINGYTDNKEAIDIDAQKLSQDRAQIVAEFLTRRGIQAHRFSLVANGDNNPVASNDTETGRKQNRRVEIVVKEYKAIDFH